MSMYGKLNKKNIFKKEESSQEKELFTMSTPTSSTISFIQLYKEGSSRTMNLTNVTQLEDQATFNVWSSTMIAVFPSMKLVEVVVDRMKSASNKNEDERKAYESLSNSALGIFIQVVS